MNKLIGVSNKVIIYVAGGLAAVAFIFAVLNPLTRVAWGATFTWTQTGAVWVVAIMSMFVAGAVSLEGGHTKIEMFSNKLKGLPKKVLDCFNGLVLVAFTIIALCGSVGRTLELHSGEISHALGKMSFPFWVFFLCFSIGLFSLAICSILKLITTIREPSKINDREEL